MKSSDSNSHVHAIRWQDDQLVLLDQRLLPQRVEYIHCSTASDVATAIRDMVVRGAPAIGISAAYGVVLAARGAWETSAGNWRHQIIDDLERLSLSRPTAINLQWALNRMQDCFNECEADPVTHLLSEAMAIHTEDIQANRQMGELGAAFIDADSSVLTHCNAGALATGGYGTALGVIRTAWSQDKLCNVFADETRPWLQGARLTAWELLADGIPVSLIAEGAAAWLMKNRRINWVIVGSDRISANGDVANKIGTYQLALTARFHGVRVMVVAPTSTIDMSLPTGEDIPIEQRDVDELLMFNGQHVAATGATAWNPVFDVTPAELVDVIVTDKGVVEKPDTDKMQALMKKVCGYLSTDNKEDHR